MTDDTLYHSNKMSVFAGRFGLISLQILHSQYLGVELFGNMGSAMWPENIEPLLIQLCINY